MGINGQDGKRIERGAVCERGTVKQRQEPWLVYFSRLGNEWKRVHLVYVMSQRGKGGLTPGGDALGWGKGLYKSPDLA